MSKATNILTRKQTPRRRRDEQNYGVPITSKMKTPQFSGAGTWTHVNKGPEPKGRGLRSAGVTWRQLTSPQASRLSLARAWGFGRKGTAMRPFSRLRAQVTSGHCGRQRSDTETRPVKQRTWHDGDLPLLTPLSLLQLHAHTQCK